jgi:hypothetical protein
MRVGFIARFANWLQKLDRPPSMAPTPENWQQG